MLIYSVMKQEIEWVIESFLKDWFRNTDSFRNILVLPIDTTLFVDGTKIDKAIVNIMSKM